MKNRVQDAASHQYPDSIRMNESWRNFCIMEELFEERRKGKAEPCTELLLAKEDGVGRLFLNRRSKHRPLNARICHLECGNALETLV